ncbi:MAG: carbon-nitrogen hydrolase family protein [Steroidobacteraceae bacterium]|nr:carbon-nitrogen hydrolase family protein [Steroidobacteraceae bacterium]
MNRFAVAGLQLDLPRGDNLDRIEREIDSVHRRFPWVQMVVVGELAAFGPDPAHAQPMPGPAEQRLCAAARRNQLWLVPGSMFERQGDQIFNTAPVIDPHGQVVARYRKMFPFCPYEQGVTAGDQFVVFDVPGVARFGVSICYDMWFPETTRSLAWLGAEVILHPTMTNTIDRDIELSIARASAAINQCWFIDINVAGDLGFGRSGIYAPGGDIVYEAGAGREILTADLDLDAVRAVRTRGWHGLTQPLKSFRDSKLRFPPYIEGHDASPQLQALGPLAMPRRPGAEPND